MFLFYVNPILIAAAVIPAIVLLRFVYKEDRLDKESPGLLLSLVIFGILSTFAAIVTEQIGEAILGILLPRNSTAYNVLLYFVVVALSEEGFKYLLLRKRTWWSGEFNCQFDGVVYAVFVSLGFALWENISYVLMYGLGTAAVRAVTAVPGHACFGVFMGAFYGLAERYDNFGDEYRSRRCRRLAVLVPVLLHVGLGTFRPVKEDAISDHVMHTEHFEISRESADIINSCKGRVVAVGTTSCRVLESAADESGHIDPMTADTGIFIYPGYRFKRVDALITNFHLPKSTLLMLVSAFAGYDLIKKAYAHAIAEKYRFFSYGDAMLLKCISHKNG